jgi:hypothetical protein
MWCAGDTAHSSCLLALTFSGGWRAGMMEAAKSPEDLTSSLMRETKLRRDIPSAFSPSYSVLGTPPRLGSSTQHDGSATFMIVLCARTYGQCFPSSVRKKITTTYGISALRSKINSELQCGIRILSKYFKGTAMSLTLWYRGPMPLTVSTNTNSRLHATNIPSRVPITASF